MTFSGWKRVLANGGFRLVPFRLNPPFFVAFEIVPKLATSDSSLFSDGKLKGL